MSEINWNPLLHFCCHEYSHYLLLVVQVSSFTGPCDWCSSSLPQTQSTVVLIKLCAALLTSSPMVILGRSQCESGCKPPREPIRAPISPYVAFMHSFLSISHICLYIGLEFDCEICSAIADLDHTWDISLGLKQCIRLHLTFQVVEILLINC